MAKDKNKDISTFLDFETIDDTTPSREEMGVDELGVSYTRARKFKGKLLKYLVCPLCGMHRKMFKNGMSFVRKSKARGWGREAVIKDLQEGRLIKSERSSYYNPSKETGFSSMDLKVMPFISLRRSDGRQSGFSEIEIITFDSIIGISDDTDREVLMGVVKELRDKCKEILEYTEELFGDI
jgi:hypothetical protein